MDWIDEIIDQLCGDIRWGYLPAGPLASEPTALVALALLGYAKFHEARTALDCLGAIQDERGAVGVTRTDPTPTWPTSLSVLAWHQFQQQTKTDSYQANISRGLDWMLATEGHTQPRTKNIAHDTSLRGWPWAEGTHAWVEPTAMHLIALQAVEQAAHPRSREATQLLLDRQLPSGGCNYGNTFVFNQQLLPHVQSTGLAMLALVHATSDSRTAKSRNYLKNIWPEIVGTPSLCYAAMGLAAHGVVPVDRLDRLHQAYCRRVQAGSLGAYPAALLALASLPPAECPLRVTV